MNRDVVGRSSPGDVASRFIDAIAWGEHTVVWELLSHRGRATAITVALANGLDRVIAARISDGLADPAELDDFLRQLLHGLRRDLRSVEVADVQVADVQVADVQVADVQVANVEVAGCHLAGRSAVVLLSTPSAIPSTEPWAAGRVVMSEDDAGAWAVDHLEPVVAGP